MISRATDYTSNPSEYDRYAPHINSRYIEAHSIQNDLVIEALEAIPSPVILDLGSGTGYDALILTERNRSAVFYGVDQSQSMGYYMMQKAEMCGRNGRVNFVACKIQDITLNPKSFEVQAGESPPLKPSVVISAFTCHHLDATTKRELYKKLRSR